MCWSSIGSYVLLWAIDLLVGLRVEDRPREDELAGTVHDDTARRVRRHEVVLPSGEVVSTHALAERKSDEECADLIAASDGLGMESRVSYGRPPSPLDRGPGLPS